MHCTLVLITTTVVLLLYTAPYECSLATLTSNNIEHRPNSGLFCSKNTMRTVQLITLLSLAAPALAATALKVDVYEGPTECSDEDKVHSGDHLEIRYTGTIDESSETGEKGSKFDSSVDRDDTFEFQIGQGAVIKGCKCQHQN